MSFLAEEVRGTRFRFLSSISNLRSRGHRCHAGKSGSKRSKNTGNLHLKVKCQEVGRCDDGGTRTRGVSFRSETWRHITWKKVMKVITDLEGETYTVGLASWRYKVVKWQDWNSVTRGYSIIKELCHGTIQSNWGTVSFKHGVSPERHGSMKCHYMSWQGREKEWRWMTCEWGLQLLFRAGVCLCLCVCVCVFVLGCVCLCACYCWGV